MLFLNLKETAIKIKSIKVRGANLQSDIHQVACSTLAHIRDHGDYTLAVSLMNAIPTGVRVKGLALWFHHFSNGKFAVRQDKKQGNIWVGSVNKDRSPEDFLVDDAVKVTFADFTTEPVKQEITVEKIKKYLEGLINNEVILADGKTQVSPEALETAVRLLKTLEVSIDDII